MATVFMVTTLIWDPSAALASLDSFELPAQAKFQKELQSYLYSVPAEIGTIQEASLLGTTDHRPQTTDSIDRNTSRSERLQTPVSSLRSRTGDSRFVVLIQDAHANPEGQRNVAAMMRYLEAKFPDLAIGLEGAVGELHPENLDLFKEFPAANHAVIEDLKAKGELNGAELFLLEKHQKRLETRDQRLTTKDVEASAPVSSPNSYQLERSGNWGSPDYRRLKENISQDSLQSVVSGVEDAALYRDSLQAYRDLLSKRHEIQTLLSPIRAEIEKESSTKLNSELRDFLKERSRRKEGRFDVSASRSDPNLQAYIRYLQKQSLKFLEVDLKDTIEQLRFPSLLRVVMLEEAQKDFDPAKAKSQWTEVVRTLRSLAKDEGEKEFVGSLGAFAAKIQEGGGRRGEGASSSSPSASLHPISAAQSAALYPRKLLEGLFRFGKKHNLSFAGQDAFWQSWKLAVLQAEIDVTELLQEMSLLEGGLIQKLARSEEEKALVRKIENLDLLEKLLRLEVSRPEYDKALAEQGALNSLIANSKLLAGSLEKAYHFYDVSLKRDEALVANLLKVQGGGWRMEDGEKKLASSALRPPPSRLSVLYAGGFHTPGIETILRQKGIGYAVFTPRITKTDHGKMYQDVMSGSNADLSAYFKVKNPFQTKQEALIFKQLIETAAPVLSGKYQLKPDQVAASVAQAVSSSPVFSDTLKADQQKDPPSAIRFTPKAGPGIATSQNSSVMAIPSATIGRAEARLLDPMLQPASEQPVVITFSAAAPRLHAPRSETRGTRAPLNMTLRYTEAFYETLMAMPASQREDIARRLYDWMKSAQHADQERLGEYYVGESIGGYQKLKRGAQGGAMIRAVFDFHIDRRVGSNSEKRRTLTLVHYLLKGKYESDQKGLAKEIQNAAARILNPADMKDRSKIQWIEALLYGSDEEKPADLGDFEIAARHLEDDFFKRLQYTPSLTGFLHRDAQNMTMVDMTLKRPLGPEEKPLLYFAIHEMQEALQQSGADLEKAVSSWLGEQGLRYARDQALKMLQGWLAAQIRIQSLIEKELKDQEPSFQDIATVYFDIAGPELRNSIQAQIEEWAKRLRPSSENLANIELAIAALEEGDGFDAQNLRQTAAELDARIRELEAARAAAVTPEVTAASHVQGTPPVATAVPGVAIAPSEPVKSLFFQTLEKSASLQEALGAVRSVLAAEGVSSKLITDETAVKLLAAVFDPAISNNLAAKEIQRLTQASTKGNKIGSLRRKIEEAAFPFVADILSADTVTSFKKEFLARARAALLGVQIGQARKMLSLVKVLAGREDQETASLEEDILFAEKWMRNLPSPEHVGVIFLQEQLIRFSLAWENMPEFHKEIVRSIHLRKLPEIREGKNKNQLAVYFYPFLAGASSMQDIAKTAALKGYSLPELMEILLRLRMIEAGQSLDDLLVTHPGLAAAVQAGRAMVVARSEARGRGPSEETLRRDSREALERVRGLNPWADGLSGDFEGWEYDLPALQQNLPPEEEVIYPRVSGDMIQISDGNSISPSPEFFHVFIKRIRSFLSEQPGMHFLPQGKSLVVLAGNRSWTISPPNGDEDALGKPNRRSYLETTAESIREAIRVSRKIASGRSEARTGEPLEIRPTREGMAYEVFQGATAIGQAAFVYGPQTAAAQLAEILAKAGLAAYQDPGAPHRIVFDSGPEIGAVSVPITDLKQIKAWLACVVSAGPSVATGRTLAFLRDGVPVIHLRSEARGEHKDGGKESSFSGTVTLFKTVFGSPVAVSPEKYAIFWWIPQGDRKTEEKDYEAWYENMHALLKKYLPLALARQWSAVIQHEKRLVQAFEKEHPEKDLGDLKNHLISKVVQAIEEKLDRNIYPELEANKNAALIFRVVLEDQARIAAVNAKMQELLAGADDEKKSDFLRMQKSLAAEVVQKRLTEIQNQIASAQNRQKKMKRDQEQIKAWQEESAQLSASGNVAFEKRISALRKAVSRYAPSPKEMEAAKELEKRGGDVETFLTVMSENINESQGSVMKIFFDMQQSMWRSLSTRIERLAEAEKKVERKEEGAEQALDIADHDFMTYYDTGRLFRDAGAEFLDRLEQALPGLERKLIEPGENLQPSGAIVLVVDGPVMADDVKKELRKYGPRVVGIIGGWGTITSHWAQLVRGMEGAPPIFFFSDNGARKAAFDDLNKSETVAVRFSKQSGWQLVLHPSEETLTAALSEQQKEKLLEQGQRTLLAYPIDIRVNVNLAAGQWVDLKNSEADGSGLIRTDFLGQEEQGLLLKIEEDMASGSFQFEEWFAALKHFHMGRGDEERNLVAFQNKIYGALKDSGNMQRLLGSLTGLYRDLLQDPFFAGKKVPFRTLDLQNDSKGKDLLQGIVGILVKAASVQGLLVGIPAEVAKDPKLLSEAICGMDFYKKTALGKFFLATQMAAFFIAYGHHLDKNKDVETSLLQIFFPMVSTAEDVEFIQNEILPVAKMLAALNLDPAKEWSPDNLTEMLSKADRIVEKTQFGIMVETLGILEDEETSLSLVQHPFVSFFKIGTNDLELAIVRRKLGKPVSRDDETVQSMFGHLQKPLREGLDRFFNRVLEKAPQKPICVCGALGADPVFQLYLEHWRRKGLKTAVSVGLDDVVATHHRFLRYRMLSDHEFAHLFQGALNEQEFEYEANLTVDEALDVAKPFLMREAAFEKRDRQSGFLQGIDRDTVDPTQKIGGFADVLGLQGLLRDFGEADPNEEVDPDILIRDAEPLLPDTIEREIIQPLLRRGILSREAKDSFLNAIVFLQNAWKLQRRLAAQEDRFHGVLRGKNLDDFIELFEKEGSLGALSPAEAVLEKQDIFCSRYYSSTRLIRDTNLSVIHEKYLELYGEEVQDEGEIVVLGFLSSGEPVPLRLRRWRGMMAKQDQRPGYSDVFELYIPVSNAFESRGRMVAYLRKHPAALMQIFSKSGWHGDREIRMSYPLRQMMREAIAGAELSQIAPEEMGKLRASFSAFLKESRDQSYPVFRMDIFGFFEKFFPGFQEMVGYFPRDGRKRPLHVRVLNAYGFVERLPQNLDFPFQRVSRIVQRLRRDPETLAMFRMSVLAAGIVAARSKQRAGIPFVPEVRKIVEQLLGQWGIEFSRDLIERMVWLICQEAIFHDQDLMTLREIAKAIESLFGSARNLSSQDLDLLYLWLFSVRATRVDQEKRVMLKIQGPDSSLANWDKFYLAAFHALQDRSKSRPMKWDELVIAASQTVRSGKTVIGSAENLPVPSSSMASVIGNMRFLWQEFRRLLPQEMERFQSLNGASQDLLETVKAINTDYRLFLENVSRMQKLMTPYYLRSLPDSAHWVSVFLSFLSLRGLEKTQKGTVVFNANALSHQYANQAFEISFMRPVTEPGMLAIYSRILFQYGFSIESVDMERDGDRVLARFVGSFFEEKHPSELLRSMAKDLKDIFGEAQPEYHQWSLWWERFVRFMYKMARPFLVMFTRDQRNAPELFRNMYRLYGDLQVSRPESSSMIADSSVMFTGDRHKSGMEYSTFVIETEDRPRGLTALIAAFFSLRGLNIVDFHFDDTQGQRCRIIVHVNEARSGAVLSRQEQQYIAGHLPAILNAPQSGVHRVGFLNRYELNFQRKKETAEKKKDRSEWEAAPAAVPIRSVPGQGDAPASHISIPEQPERAEAPSSPSLANAFVREFLVAAPYGVHQKPAGLLARLIRNHPGLGDVRIECEGVNVSLKDPMAMLTLEATQGKQVVISIPKDVAVSPEKLQAFWRDVEAITDEDASGSTTALFAVARRSEVRDVDAGKALDFLGEVGARWVAGEIPFQGNFSVAIARTHPQRVAVDILLREIRQVLFRHQTSALVAELLARLGLLPAELSEGNREILNSLMMTFRHEKQDLEHAIFLEAIHAMEPASMELEGTGESQVLLGRTVVSGVSLELKIKLSELLTPQAFGTRTLNLMERVEGENPVGFSVIINQGETGAILKMLAKAHDPAVRKAILRSETRGPAFTSQNVLDAIERFQADARISGRNPFKELAAEQKRLRALMLEVLVGEYFDLIQTYARMSEFQFKDYSVDPVTLSKEASDWEHQLIKNPLTTVITFMQMLGSQENWHGDEAEVYKSLVVNDGKKVLLVAELKRRMEEASLSAQIRELFNSLTRSGRNPSRSELPETRSEVRVEFKDAKEAARWVANKLTEGLDALAQKSLYDPKTGRMTVSVDDEVGIQAWIDWAAGLGAIYQGLGQRVDPATLAAMPEDVRAIRKTLMTGGIMSLYDIVNGNPWTRLNEALQFKDAEVLLRAQAQIRHLLWLAGRLEVIAGSGAPVELFTPQGRSEKYIKGLAGLEARDPVSFSDQELLVWFAERGDSPEAIPGNVKAWREAHPIDKRSDPNERTEMPARPTVATAPSTARGFTNYERMVNLLRHDLSGKIGVLLSAEETKDVSKQSLRDVVSRTLVVFRIFDLEQFMARCGELYVPEGNENIFAYRILSRRLDKLYQTPAFVGMKAAQSFDETELRLMAAEVGFERFQNHFSDVVRQLEELRDELLQTGELSRELRIRIKDVGELLQRKMGQLPSSLISEAAPVVAMPVKEIKRILVVDDEASIRTLLAIQLRSMGYVVVTAANGVEALEKNQKGEIDLLFTDLTMPRMGGIELARTLVKARWGIPIIFMSGFSSSSVSPEEFIRAKLHVDFLQKPFRKADIEAAIKKISGRSEARVVETTDEDVRTVEVARRLGIKEDIAGQKIFGLSLEEFARRKHLFAEAHPDHAGRIFAIGEAYESLMGWYHYRANQTEIHDYIMTEARFSGKEAETQKMWEALHGKVSGASLALKKKEYLGLFRWAVREALHRKYLEIVKKNTEEAALFGSGSLNVRNLSLADMPWIPLFWDFGRYVLDEPKLSLLLSDRSVQMSQDYYAARKISLRELGDLKDSLEVPDRTDPVPHQMELPLLFRSEVRLQGTAEFKTSLLDTATAEPLSVVPEIIVAAERVGGIYSLKDIALDQEGGITEDNLRKARLWITDQLLKAFRTQQNVKGKVDNPDLQKVLKSLDRYRVTGAKDSAPEERGVHVVLPVLERSELEALAGLAPVFLALAVALNAKLYLNAQVDPKGVSHLKALFMEAARRNGITLGEDQLGIFSAFEGKGSVFTSREQQGVPEDALLAAQEAQLPDSHDRATLWYNSKHAQLDMKTLAAEITEALYAALDQKVTKNSKRDISTYGQQLTAAIVNAIQASLKILVAA